MDGTYGGKHTKQKDAIYSQLKKLNHPSATQIYESLKDEHPAISRATVFRVLSLFAQKGYIKKLGYTDADARFDWRTNEHCHFFCRICGRVEDVNADCTGLKPVLPDGFTVEKSDIFFTGVCDKCVKK